MASSFERIRSRTYPKKVSGNVTIGKKYPWNTNLNNWHPTHNFVATHAFNMPWIGGEVTGDQKNPGPPYRSGGPFKRLRIERLLPHAAQGFGTYYHFAGGSPSLWEKYVGGFAPPGVSEMETGLSLSNVSQALSINSSLFPDLQAQSSLAWRKTKPKLEKANLFVSMVEARDIPRMLRTTAKALASSWRAAGGNLTGEVMSPKGAADQFLNHEFGWVPFLKDLRTLYSVYHGSEAYMKRVTETNGRPTRRRSTLIGIPVVEAGPDGKPRIRYGPTHSDIILSSGVGQMSGPSLSGNYFSGTPRWELREIVEDKVTASGKFTFYRPEFDTGLSEYNSAWFAIQRQLTMYGLRINPSNVYRATPWTWLIDWFVNVGEHFDLLTDMLVDSIVANYLFIVERKRTVRKFVQTLPFAQTGTLSLEWNLEINSLERVGANSPYGMSLSWDNLTPRQLVILGALGITRSRPAGG